MGAFQAIPKYLAIVVLGFVFACHEVVLTHGRQIKAMNLQHSLLNKHTSININGNVPTSEKKIVHSPTITIPTGFGDSNAFRPTTPGKSPGVGHRKFGEEYNKDIKAKVESTPVVKQYVTLTEGSQTDFKPTKPGHSPGVGHAASQNNNN